ncbi:MAG TPA: hypothetical protein VMC83_12785 [Streptosporangiaceae bacterium]|nr:hypothetical protein [Streptosporangiaceae bacterium]
MRADGIKLRWRRADAGGTVKHEYEAKFLSIDLARFGSVDGIYKTELGRDILAEPTLLFASVTE